jgi:hypothetical protein
MGQVRGLVVYGADITEVTIATGARTEGGFDEDGQKRRK